MRLIQKFAICEKSKIIIGLSLYDKESTYILSNNFLKVSAWLDKKKHIL